MTSNANATDLLTPERPPPSTVHSPALDVGFESLGGGKNGEAGSSERAGSISSSGRRSGRSWRSREKEKEKERSGNDNGGDDGARDGSTRKESGEERHGGLRESLGHRTRRSGGFLLEGVFGNGSPKGGDNGGGRGKTQEGQLRVDKRRSRGVHSRVSGESSQRGSPLAREMVWDGHADPRESGSREGTPEMRRMERPASMDPAQLVQMALSLSEGRKRNVSNSLPVSLAAGSKRVASMPMGQYGTVRATSGVRKRSGQVLSDGTSKDSPRSGYSGAESHEEEAEEPVSAVDNVVYTFSPATLSRAEKARKYFELASEHRRLLQHLPPLKPDASAPGNYTFESRGTPGSPYAEMHRVISGAENKHALGRQYNPIQALRNRRVRIREKRPFTAPPDSWMDEEAVRKWIDEVESATEDPFYRATADQAQLPKYAGDDNEVDTTLAQQPFVRGHRKTDTVGSVITRPENSWTIEPTELLADTYWTEKGDNKSYIENRHGNPIFGPAPRRSVETPKISIEMHRDKPDLAETGVDSADFADSGNPSRRRRLMMPLMMHTDSHRRKHRRLISRSPSETSESDAEEHIAHGAAGGENIAPLERHMQDLIAQDEAGMLSSPELTSPDHWDARPLPQPRGSIDQQQSFRDSLTRPEGRSSLEVPRETFRRSRSADGRTKSYEERMEPTTQPQHDSEPTTPAPQDMTATSGLAGFTQQGGRQSLDIPRPQGPPQAPKLPTFRPRSKERKSIAQLDLTAATATALAPIMSGDTWRPGRTSQEVDRPKEVSRHKTNDSLAGSLLRLDTASTAHSSLREPGSTVGRLFKGGKDRIGTLVRGERARNRDKLGTGSAAGSFRNLSDMSDVDEADGPNGYLRRWKVVDSAGDDSDVSPRESVDLNRSKQKYQLPSFTSSSRDRKVVPGTPITAETNPFERDRNQQNDAGKSQRLVPPRLNITAEGDEGSNTAPMARTIKFDTARKSYGDLGLDAPLPSANTAMSRSPGRRHWSIYDQAQIIQQTGRITARDIASARALLLCSGIKAREIQRRANTPRDSAPEVLQAAETAGKPAPTVPLREEHLAAARLLSDHLTSSFSTLESALTTFQSTTSRDLATSLDDLRHRASEQLTTQVHDASDEADAFIVELTTKQPQQTKRVDDAVDLMLRRRRRKFWLLRQVGFKVLEWTVLGIMWWIWFVVVVIQFVRRVAVGMGRFVRWLVVF